MVQELVPLTHGISLILEMTRQVYDSDRRVYHSFAGKKPTRTIVSAWNTYRFQSGLAEAFRECLCL